jgi:ribonuclease E
VGDAPAVEPQTVSGPVVETAADRATERVEAADPAADAVEEVVVERSLAGRRNGAPAPDEPADDRNGSNGTARPRRRGRVTRTAGAPAPTSGDAPAVAVVTVPAEGAAAPSAPTPVPPQPEPTVTARPRRARRAASRPAGPPPGAESGETDPV